MTKTGSTPSSKPSQRSAVADLQDHVQRTFTDVEQTFRRELQQVKDDLVQHARAKLNSLQAAVEAAMEKERLQADLQLKELQLTGLDAIVESALQKTKEQIEKMRTTPTYAQALTRFLRQALDYTPHTNVVVQGTREDAELLRRITHEVSVERDVTITVADEPLDDVGGIVVRSEDATFTYINTMTGRIEELKQVLRHLVLTHLKG